MKKLLFIALVLIIGCGNINEEGYYKSDDRDRVYVFSFKDESKQDILEHAHDRMWTGGRFTSAYYYKQGDDATSVGNKVSGSLYFGRGKAGLLMANSAISNSASEIQYAYKRTLMGYDFADCKKEPDDDLCN